MKLKSAHPMHGLMLGALTCALLCAPAWAALGGSATSVETDRQHMKGQLRMSAAPEGYTVQEITTPAGTVVREYVSATGQVFAVSWRGPVMPNLRQMLGAYFARYAAAAAAPHPGHRHLNIEQPDLVIHSAGHMRNFFGSAYLPGMLPANLAVDAIK